MIKKLNRQYIDIEANGLYPTLIHCIVCENLDTGEIRRFRPNSPLGGHHDFRDEFIAFAATVDVWVGHNIIGYDRQHINRLFEAEIISFEDCIDTLVLSRLLRPTMPYKQIPTDNRQGGHSLEAWGLRLGFPKIKFDKWDVFSEEMLDYCQRDIALGVKVYWSLMEEKKGFSQECIDLEHWIAEALYQQEVNGFYLNQKVCQGLIEETDRLLKEMTDRLQVLFPPVWEFVRELELKVNKDGSKASVPLRILSAYQSNPSLKAEQVSDTTYHLYEQEAFNPNSDKQVVKRLLGLGWVPKRFTEKGSVKADRDTLAEALKELIKERPELEALRCLADYGIVTDRNTNAKKWFQLAKIDGRVHGRINTIGASTHRAAHYDPNMANIASVVTAKFTPSIHDSKYNFDNLPRFDEFDCDGHRGVFLEFDGKKVKYAKIGLDGTFGWESRSCWSVPEGKILVGADAAGIQLRALAHYINDPAYTKQLLEGDIHVVHQEAAGIKDRDTSKTFIYAWLLGAGDEKVGTIVGVTEDEYDALFSYARQKTKWETNLLAYIMEKVRAEGRKADKKTIATIIKGFKVKEQFLNRIPALKAFKEGELKKAAKRGYMIGLDGRKIWIENEHLAMGAYLQGFETVVMRLAMLVYQEDLNGRSTPFMQVQWTHDEFGAETFPEYGEIVGQSMVRGIEQAGIELKSNCPLTGSYRVGKSWAEVH